MVENRLPLEKFKGRLSVYNFPWFLLVINSVHLLRVEVDRSLIPNLHWFLCSADIKLTVVFLEPAVRYILDGKAGDAT